MWIQKLRTGVTHLAFSLTGHRLYVLDKAGWLTAWDVQTRTTIWSRQFDREPAWRIHSLIPLANEGLVYRANQFVLLDSLGNTRSKVDLTPGRIGYEQILPTGVVYYPDAKDHHLIHGWDLVAGAPVPGFDIPPLVGVRPPSSAFRLSPDGRTMCVIFSHGEYASDILWEVGEDHELRNLIPVPGVKDSFLARFSPDGRTLAFLYFYPSAVSLWDVPKQVLRVAKIACSQDDRLLDFHPAAPLFAALNPEGAPTLFSTETGEPIRSFDFALGKEVGCIRFSPDGLTCAVGGSNKQFAVFDVDV